MHLEQSQAIFTQTGIIVNSAEQFLLDSIRRNPQYLDIKFLYDMRAKWRGTILRLIKEIRATRETVSSERDIRAAYLYSVEENYQTEMLRASLKNYQQIGKNLEATRNLYMEEAARRRERMKAKRPAS